MADTNPLFSRRRTSPDYPNFYSSNNQPIPMLRSLKATSALWFALIITTTNTKGSGGGGSATGSVTAFQCSYYRTFHQKQTSTIFTTIRSSSSSFDGTVSTNPDSEWTMVEDWALVDTVPLYTVRSTSSSFSSKDPSLTSSSTFWTQLIHATPELSRRSEEDALERYRQLCKDPSLYRGNVGKYPSSSSSSSPPSLVEAGKSPPLLQNWNIVERQSTTFLVGSLIDTGSRRVWFPLRCIGRLGDDPVVDWTDVGDPSSFVGGFAEAVGGVLYELGDVADVVLRGGGEMRTALGSVGDDTVVRGDEKGVVGGEGWFPQLRSLFFSEDGSGTPSTIATLCTIIVTSFLSVCIGFGAGTGHAINAGTMGSAATTITGADATTMVLRQSSPSSSSSFSPVVSKIAYVEPSVSELRARQELRVLKEKRLKENLEASLVVDEVRMKELMGQEAKGLPVSSSSDSVNTKGPKVKVRPPGVSELRAQQELRVLREKRLLENVGNRLETDEVLLKSGSTSLEPVVVREKRLMEVTGRRLELDEVRLKELVKQEAESL